MTGDHWSCELRSGSSVYGDATASWLPPGVVCTHVVDVGGAPLEVVTRPPVERLVVVVAAVIGLPVLLYLQRLLRRQAAAVAWSPPPAR